MGWPVAWLKEMIDADEFDLWCRWHQIRPIDDESNFHVPLASLQATYVNSHRQEGSQPVTLQDCLIFRPTPDVHIDDVLLNSNW